jgi:hypothetical protein
MSVEERALHALVHAQSPNRGNSRDSIASTHAEDTEGGGGAEEAVADSGL